jgi:aspartate/methionine/tyrosine aminotransferase
MFERRGFEPEILWRTRVQQAADTDIRPLVELEARTGSLFAFHLRRHSPGSVSARVAEAAREAGRPIYHEVQVIEGRPRSEALFGLARALSNLALPALWEQVDLSRASGEQIAFVTRLAEGFAGDPRAPYPHEAGDPGFRRKVTDFLRKFHSLSLAPEEAFAAPSRPELREMGFEVEARGGGLSLFPDARPLGGQAEALTLELEARARVRFNTPSWSGTEGHLRACYALPEARLEEALDRLRRHFEG